MPSLVTIKIASNQPKSHVIVQAIWLTIRKEMKAWSNDSLGF